MYLPLQLSVSLFVPIFQRPVIHHTPMVTTSRRGNKEVVWKMNDSNAFSSKGYFSRRRQRDFRKVQQQMKFDERKRARSRRSLKLERRWFQERHIAHRKGRQEKKKNRKYVAKGKYAKIDFWNKKQLWKGKHKRKRKTSSKIMKIQSDEFKSRKAKRIVRKKQLKRRRQINNMRIVKLKVPQRNKCTKKMRNKRPNNRLRCKKTRMKRMGKINAGNKLAMNRNVRMKQAKMKKVMDKEARIKKARSKTATNRKVRMQRAMDKKARIKKAQRRRFARQMNKTVETPRCGNADIPQSRSMRNGR